MAVIGNVSSFFKGVFDELKKVNWPTRREALYLTVIVIASVAVATLLMPEWTGFCLKF
jgi:preprotein translocase subunit SecE